MQIGQRNLSGREWHKKGGTQWLIQKGFLLIVLVFIFVFLLSVHVLEKQLRIHPSPFNLGRACNCILSVRGETKETLCKPNEKQPTSILKLNQTEPGRVSPPSPLLFVSTSSSLVSPSPVTRSKIIPSFSVRSQYKKRIVLRQYSYQQVGYCDPLNPGCDELWYHWLMNGKIVGCMDSAIPSFLLTLYLISFF